MEISGSPENMECGKSAVWRERGASISFLRGEVSTWHVAEKGG
jgi:hypothetical protein